MAHVGNLIEKLMEAIDIEHGPGTTPFFNDTVAENRWNVQGQVRNSRGQSVRLVLNHL